MKLNADVVIVGSGVAGLFSALNLPEEQEIILITKSDLESSDSFLAQGGICVLRDEKDYDSYFEDTMKAGHYENRKESVDIMIRNSRDIINDLVKYGVEFEKKDGKFAYTREGAHSRPRILFHEDVTGKEITSKLLAQGSDGIIALLQAALGTGKLGIIGRLACLFRCLDSVFRIVNIDLQALALFLQRGELARDGITLAVDRNDGIQVVHNEEAADDLGNVKECILRQLAGRVQLRVHGILLLFGELCILGFQLVALFFQLVELLAALFQMLDGVRNVLRCQIIQRTAIVHRAAVGLMVELEDSAAQR